MLGNDVSDVEQQATICSPKWGRLSIIDLPHSLPHTCLKSQLQELAAQLQMLIAAVSGYTY